ncbi:MAG: hypothetical protein JNL40_09775 [Cyclobacteriaceae bacterium]|nr:hypothetical protein [Cyclobacteriaceae bacterium]
MQHLSRNVLLSLCGIGAVVVVVLYVPFEDHPIFILNIGLAILCIIGAVLFLIYSPVEQGALSGKTHKIMFGISAFLAIPFLFFATTLTYKESAEKIDASFIRRDSIIQSALNLSDSNLAQIQKLKNQFVLINEIKQPHLFMAKSFSAFMFAFSIFLTAFSIGSAVIAAMVLKAGWTDSLNDYVKISMVIVFFYTTFFGVISNVVNTKESVKNNYAKYNQFTGVQLDIVGLLQDNKGLIGRKELDSLDFYIDRINSFIKENQALYFDTSDDKVPKEVKSPI